MGDTTTPQETRVTWNDFKKGLGVILRLLRPYRRNMIVFIVFGFLVAIGNTLLPYIVGSFVDALVSPEQVAYILGNMVPLWLAVLALWALVRLVVIVLQDHIWRHSDNQGVWLYAEYLVDGFSHLTRLPLSFHKTHKIGEIITKINYTANYIERMVANTFLQLGPQVLSIVTALAMTLVINVEIGAVLTLTLFGYMLIFKRGVGLLGVLQTKSYDAIHAAWGDAGDYINNVRQVKEVVAEESARNHMYNMFRVKLCRLWQRMHARSADLSLTQELTTFLAQFFIFTYSTYLILNNALTIGELLAVNGFAAMVFGPFSIITRTWKDVQNGIVNINETQKILNLPEEVCIPQGAVTLETIRGDVSFENVSFGYDEKRTILHDLSFEAQAGQTVAIVGESGVGKTTLVDLILGFHMPTTGSVHIDGVPTDRLDLHFLRKYVAIVTQDIVLFNDTVEKNLSFGFAEANRASIEHAAEQASARSFIEEFPDKWEQVVGERGIKLSGGQRQRIAIARAILKDPSILILDEPTSALDARTEHALQQSLEKIMAGKTTFVIAHRFSTVKNADLILVLKDGTIVERGTHEELLAQGGEYQHLYELQIGLRE